MSERLAVRRRDPHGPSTRRGLHRTHSKRAVAWFGAASPVLSGAGPAPSLGFEDDDDRRDVWISGGLSALLHVLLLALLVTGAALAPPEMVERIIPVELRRPAVELPGTHAQPAPAGPKAVGEARPSAAALAASAAPALSAAEAEALRQAALEAARAALEAMESPRPVTAPTQIERNAIQADTMAARAAAVESRPSDIVVRDDLAPLDIDAADLAALDLGELDGPRAVDTSSFGALDAPEAFAALKQLEGREYTGAATLGEVATGASMAGATGDGNGVDTGVSAEWAGSGASGVGGGGGGTGGSGSVTGSVPCLESAFVQRYLDRVRDRTNEHWIVPDGVAPDAQVKLRFHLDDAGMASQIETLEAADELLGRSAEAALRNAAPFPPMDQNNRCLSADRIRLTFTVPRD
jgi:hypothetical protein